jgi:hypothetical protein
MSSSSFSWIARAPRALGVLDQEHHQEGDDRRGRANDQLSVWRKLGPSRADADHDAQAPRKTSADLTNSELRRANFRNCSYMSSMRRTGGVTRYEIRLGAFLHSV